MITVFSPSFADEANTNAQNLTVKEVVSRLAPDQFRVILLGDGKPDPRISARPNTKILPWRQHGNTPRWLAQVLLSKVDVYFFPRQGPLDASFIYLKNKLKLRVALVTYIVMALDEIPIGLTMERSIRQADLVFGNSRFVSQTITDRFGVPARTIYDGVNRQLFYPAVEEHRGGTDLVVLYAGSFQARKRAEIVIAEAAKWPSVNFRLAGKGEEEDKIRSLVSELGCRNVTILGHLSQKALAAEMQRADIFLFPSVLEGHPQVLGQAASCGLPAIAMDLYQPDYVLNGETGYLVRSEKEISQRLGLLLSNHDLRLSMSAAAAQHALQFDWDKVAKEWENAFLEAAAKCRIKN